MECSNCGEVLESGCSVSAGLRQEDRLILDWERRHKGRSCSGALRPFGKLKWREKKREGEEERERERERDRLSIYLSCAARRPLFKKIISGRLKRSYTLSFRMIEAGLGAEV